MHPSFYYKHFFSGIYFDIQYYLEARIFDNYFDGERYHPRKVVKEIYVERANNPRSNLVIEVSGKIQNFFYQKKGTTSI